MLHQDVATFPRGVYYSLSDFHSLMKIIELFKCHKNLALSCQLYQNYLINLLHFHKTFGILSNRINL